MRQVYDYRQAQPGLNMGAIYRHPQTHKRVSTVEPSICTKYGTVPKVISRTNPIFLHSSGDTDTEQMTADTRGS